MPTKINTIRKRRRDRTKTRIANQKQLKMFEISLKRNSKSIWEFNNILTNVFPESSNTYAEFLDKNNAWQYFLKYLNHSSGWCTK